MLTLGALRHLAEQLPDGAALTLPRSLLLEALAEVAPTGQAAEPLSSGDLAVGQLTGRFMRSPSTIRGWLEAGRFPGAYKLNGRDWRVPLPAVEAFTAQQRALHRGETSETADLGAWRRSRKDRGT